VYGGFFILLSFAWGWAVDKERPDTGKQSVQLTISTLTKMQRAARLLLVSCNPSWLNYCLF